jgi:hypothetical protein
MRDRGRIAGMAERDDGDAPLGRICGLQPLVGVFEVVVGFERTRHGHLNR